MATHYPDADGNDALTHSTPSESALRERSQAQKITVRPSSAAETEQMSASHARGAEMHQLMVLLEVGVSITEPAASGKHLTAPTQSNGGQTTASRPCRAHDLSFTTFLLEIDFYHIIMISFYSPSLPSHTPKSTSSPHP